MEEEKRIKLLVKTLIDEKEDEGAREKAALSLEQLGWKPSSIREKVFFYLLIDQQDELIALGAPVTDLLVNILLNIENEVLVHYAARALDNLGWHPSSTVEKIHFLIGRYSSAFLDSSTKEKIRYELLALGEPVVELMIKTLGWHEIEWNFLEILGELGDARAIVPLLKLPEYDSTMYYWESIKKICYKCKPGKLDDQVLEELVKVLEDGDRDDKWTIAESLGHLGDKRAANSLVKVMTSDEDVNTRRIAAVAVAELRDSRAVETLIEALQDPSSFTSFPIIGDDIMHGLGKLGDSRAVEPLINVFDRNNDSDRVSAAEALGKLATPRVLEFFIKELEEEGPRYYEAAIGLGTAGDERAVKHLLKLLDKLGDPKAVGNFNNLLMNYTLILTLGNMGSDKVVDHLLEILDNGLGERGVDLTDKILALSNIGETAVRPFISLLVSWSRLTVLEKLSYIGDPFIDLLLMGLKDNNPDTRLGAATLLESVFDPRVVEPLIKTLVDDVWYVRKAAGDTLVSLASFGVPVIDPLVSLLTRTEFLADDLLVNHLDLLLKLSPSQVQLSPLKPFLISLSVDNTDELIKRNSTQLLKIFNTPVINI
ncbi:MAG: HEAT repeat domain-containing protein [Candidatus Hodarchaeales archaeon]